MVDKHRMGAVLSNDPFVTFTKSWVIEAFQICSRGRPAQVDPQHVVNIPG